MPSPLSPDLARQVLTTASIILADLDGCLAIGNKLLPGAVDLAKLAGERLVILSNNSTHLPQDLAGILAEQGLRIPARRILLAGSAAVDITAAEMPGAKIMLLGTQALKERAEAAGLKLVDKEPDAVLLARDLGFSFAKLTAAAEGLHRGAKLIVANPDLTHPGPRNCPVPETGALLQALLATCPHAAYRVIGKPEIAMFRAACRLIGTDGRDGVMIGDNPTTDGRLAENAGIAAILIGRGDGFTIPSLGDFFELAA